MIRAPRPATSGVLLLSWGAGTPHAPSVARETLRSALRSRGVAPEDTDDAVQAASELIANAVEHAIGPYELWLRSTASELICEVHDHDPTLPRLTPHSEHPEPVPRECGRGLWIVEELTAGCWGFRLTGGPRRATWRKVAWMAVPAGLHLVQRSAERGPGAVT
ncbi:ATP-binding protein [Streptomyces boninensis]|uniref:ATP-binding protein n=1 Tax=Streptomyces boninensis TaxID=2039455 RepID=UPI003B21C4A6